MLLVVLLVLRRGWHDMKFDSASVMRVLIGCAESYIRPSSLRGFCLVLCGSLAEPAE
jgi:hypothetical protein